MGGKLLTNPNGHANDAIRPRETPWLMRQDSDQMGGGGPLSLGALAFPHPLEEEERERERENERMKQ